MKFLRLLCTVWLMLLATIPVLGNTADVLAQARALQEQNQPKQAFELLKEAVTDERMKQPRFLFALAEAARRYAPLVPVPNGGDRERVKLFEGAGGVYRQLLSGGSTDQTHQLLAKHALAQLKLDMLKEAEASRKQKHYEQTMRLGQAMAKLWPRSSSGPMLIFGVGQELNKTDIQLQGLRSAVAAQAQDTSVYTLAALLEEDEEFGAGQEAALRHLEAGLRRLPNDLPLLDAKARLLLRLNRGAEASETLVLFEKKAKLVQDEKRRATYVGAAATVYEALGKLDTAQERYQWALKRQPNNLGLRVSLGSLYFSRAAQAMRTGLELTPEQAEQREALKLRTREYLDLARAELEYAHQNGKPSITTMRTLAEIYQQAGELEASKAMRSDIKKVQAGLPLR